MLFLSTAQPTLSRMVQCSSVLRGRSWTVLVLLFRFFQTVASAEPPSLSSPYLKEMETEDDLRGEHSEPDRSGDHPRANSEPDRSERGEHSEPDRSGALLSFPALLPSSLEGTRPEDLSFGGLLQSSLESIFTSESSGAAAQPQAGGASSLVERGAQETSSLVERAGAQTSSLIRLPNDLSNGNDGTTRRSNRESSSAGTSTRTGTSDGGEGDADVVSPVVVASSAPDRSERSSAKEDQTAPAPTQQASLIPAALVELQEEGAGNDRQSPSAGPGNDGTAQTVSAAAARSTTSEPTPAAKNENTGKVMASDTDTKAPEKTEKKSGDTDTQTADIAKQFDRQHGTAALVELQGQSSLGPDNDGTSSQTGATVSSYAVEPISPAANDYSKAPADATGPDAPADATSEEDTDTQTADIAKMEQFERASHRPGFDRPPPGDHDHTVLPKLRAHSAEGEQRLKKILSKEVQRREESSSGFDQEAVPTGLHDEAVSTSEDENNLHAAIGEDGVRGRGGLEWGQREGDFETEDLPEDSAEETRMEAEEEGAELERLAYVSSGKPEKLEKARKQKLRWGKTRRDPEDNGLVDEADEAEKRERHRARAANMPRAAMPPTTVAALLELDQEGGGEGEQQVQAEGEGRAGEQQSPAGNGNVDYQRGPLLHSSSPLRNHARLGEDERRGDPPRWWDHAPSAWIQQSCGAGHDESSCGAGHDSSRSHRGTGGGGRRGRRSSSDHKRGSLYCRPTGHQCSSRHSNSLCVCTEALTLLCISQFYRFDEFRICSVRVTL